MSIFVSVEELAEALRFCVGRWGKVVIVEEVVDQHAELLLRYITDQKKDQ